MPPPVNPLDHFRTRIFSKFLERRLDKENFERRFSRLCHFYEKGHTNKYHFGSATTLSGYKIHESLSKLLDYNITSIQYFLLSDPLEELVDFVGSRGHRKILTEVLARNINATLEDIFQAKFYDPHSKLHIPLQIREALDHMLGMVNGAIEDWEARSQDNIVIRSTKALSINLDRGFSFSIRDTIWEQAVKNHAKLLYTYFACALSGDNDNANLLERLVDASCLGLPIGQMKSDKRTYLFLVWKS